MTPKLLQYSRRYPRCKFIFNSLLLTIDYIWLNHEVKLFNSLMFDLTRRVRNVYFFDSHYFTEEICDSMNQSVNVERSAMRNDQSNNGIHIALRLRRLITAELVSGVAILTGTAGVSVGHCRWIRNLDSAVHKTKIDISSTIFFLALNNKNTYFANSDYLTKFQLITPI